MNNEMITNIEKNKNVSKSNYYANYRNSLQNNKNISNYINGDTKEEKKSVYYPSKMNCY